MLGLMASRAAGSSAFIAVPGGERCCTRFRSSDTGSDECETGDKGKSELHFGGRNGFVVLVLKVLRLDVFDVC